MSNKIGENVSVKFLFNTTNASSPQAVTWNNRLYTIDKIGLHYTVYKGTTLYHLFAVTSNYTYLLLSLNTKTLNWTLEEIGEYT